MKSIGWMITSSTQNIGDDFQCIAARQFVGEIAADKWIDRESMNLYRGESLSIIANGWYMHEPQNWPPSSDINPLLTSIHISNTMQKSGRVPSHFMLSKESVDYFNQFSPVGGRDTFTAKMLEKAGVSSYFSGCLTMTLEGFGKERKDYICLIDPTKELEEFIRNQTKREVLVVRPEKNDWPQNYAERIKQAEELLKVYGEAHMVITGRLHGALPSLALGTPVLLLEGKYGDERYEGLKYFVNACTLQELFSGNYPLDLEKPLENPKEYLVVRDNLKKIARAFASHKLDTIDFHQIDRENRAALAEARERVIQFRKVHRLEPIWFRELKSNIRYKVRSLENIRKG
ncbi:hypothetical protein HCC70_04080 [Streptococcus suis]|uniref:Polysaccharide pyruvyl transferase family protein n=1 Tax=Streptococcus suivaginalis TaxID=3028082 RepID=A0AA96VF14_9STRE|nr:polysaccharide pyruvyl transferase family protein [Streptococcus sp. 29896]MCK4027518.1 hypothetical protein [Streptococcus suis]WNY47892.1 polysaccharide pyruvyl transferase family protein [Streptococcus sp. 29896]